MSFEPQNELEWSLMKSAAEPAYRPQFYRVFVESNIYIICNGPVPAKSGWNVAEEAFEMKIRKIEFQGKPCLPIFSSLLRVQTFAQIEVRYIAMNALEFLKVVSDEDTEIILNPGSECGKVFTKEETQSLIDGSIWRAPETYIVEAGTRMMIGQPSEYPHELVDALKQLFSRLKQVKRAYLAHYYLPENDGESGTLVGIEVSRDFEQVIIQVRLVLQQDVHIPDPPVDFVQIAGKGGIEDYFLSNCQPFYKKKLFGLF